MAATKHPATIEPTIWRRASIRSSLTVNPNPLIGSCSTRSDSFKIFDIDPSSSTQGMPVYTYQTLAVVKIDPSSRTNLTMTPLGSLMDINGGAATAGYKMCDASKAA
jgi:hypothetical protein